MRKKLVIISVAILFVCLSFFSVREALAKPIQLGSSTSDMLNVTGGIAAYGDIKTTNGNLCINSDCKASWSAVTGSGGWTLNGANLYSNNTGNVGIGVSSPGVKLDVLGASRVTTGALNTDDYFEKVFSNAVVFPNGVANQAVDIRFGTSKAFWGYIEVEINSTYDNQNSVGKLTKVFAVGLQADGTLYTNESRVSDSMGTIPDNIAIGDISWDAANSTGKIPLSHIVSTGNNFSVRVRFFSNGGTAKGVFDNINLSSVYTLTALPRQYVNYNSNVGIGTATPGVKLVVNGGTSNALNVSGGYVNGLNSTPIADDQAVPFGYLKNNYSPSSSNVWSRTAPYVYPTTLTDNVGIGTTAPVSKLEVNASSGTGVTTGVTSGASAYIAKNGGTNSWALNPNADYSWTMYDYYGSTWTPGITQRGGNVGIGTTAPGQKLDVAGNININTNGTSALFSTYKGAGSDGNNIWIGGGGQSSLGPSGYQGSNNTAIGMQALYSNTSGYQNTAIGTQALYSNTSNGNNTANGYKALYFNTSFGNTANGYKALFYNTGGYNNTANGANALNSNTTGSYNTANGVQSLYSNTTGLQNTADGSQTLRDLNITNGTGNNTALGYNTGRGIVTGINNTILGANVTGLAATLSNNIIIADGSGNRRINVDSTGNVGIGTTAPGFKLTVDGGTSDSLDMLGGYIHGLNSTPTVVDQAVPLGYLQSNYSPSSSNVWSRTAPYVYPTTLSDNVGIGIAAPLNKLSVDGNIQMGNWTTVGSRYIGFARADTAAFGTAGASGMEIESGNFGGTGNYDQKLHFWTHTYNGGSARRMTIDNWGNVGIGTTNPLSTLSVGGNGVANTGVYGNAPASGGTGVYGIGGSGGIGVYGVGGDFSFYGLGKSYFSGNVGIGTTGPGAKLDVKSSGMYWGSGSATLLVQDDTSRGTMRLRSTSDNPVDFLFDVNSGTRWDLAARSSSEGYSLQLYNAAASPSYTSLGGPVVTVLQSGNVGIGTATPGVKLAVNGGTGDALDMLGGYIHGLNSTPTVADQAVPLGYLQSNYSPSSSNVWSRTAPYVYPTTLTDNVGIGTTNPGANLEVYTSVIDPTVGSALIKIGNPNGNIKIGTVSNSDATYTGLWYNQVTPDATNYFFQGGANRTFFNAPATGSSYLAFRIGNGTKMTVLESGNVGIGTTNPGVKLTVNGNVGADALCDSAGNNCYSSAESTVVSVGGSISNFYPVFFPRKNSYGVGIGEFILSRSSVHENVTSQGAFYGEFKFGLYNWGNTADFLDFNIRSAGGTYGTTFVADPAVQCTGSALVLYLRGASTYYFKNTRDVSDPVVYLAGTSPSECGATVNYPVKAEASVVNIYGSATNYPIARSGNTGNYYIGQGNVGIGAVNPGQKLEVSGNITTSAANNFLYAGYTAGSSNYISGLGFNSSVGGVLQLGNNGLNEIRAGTTNTGGYLNFVVNNSALPSAVNNGTIAMTILAGGNVGIGTTAPGFKLTVNGGTGDALDMLGGSIHGLNSTPTVADQAVPLGYLQANYSASSTSLWSGTRDGNIWNGAAGGGNVGIGTASPGALLQVAKDTTGEGRIIIGGGATNTNKWLTLYPQTAGDSIFHLGVKAGSKLTIANGVAGSEAALITILNTGNLGVGTVSPGQKLSVYGAANSGAINWDVSLRNPVHDSVAGAGSGIKFFGDTDRDATKWSGIAGVAESGYFDYTGLAFYTWTGGAAGSGGERMRINNAGSVGIGIVAPKGRLNTLALTPAANMTLGSATQPGLSVTASDGNPYGMYFGVNSDGNSWIQAGRTDSATAYNMSLQASGGNVGIGVTGPAVKLDVNGAIAATGSPNKGYNMNAGSYGGNTYYAYDSLCANESNGNCQGTGGVVLGRDNNSSFTNFPSSGDSFIGGSVGIGTNAPLTALNIAGGNSEFTIGTASYPQANARIGVTGRANYLDAIFSRNLSGVAGADTYQTPYTGTSGYQGMEFRHPADIAFYAMSGATTGGSIVAPVARMYIEGTNGNVGIGTTVPSQKLDVYNTIALNGKLAFDGGDTWLRLNNSNAFSGGIYAGSGVLRTDGEFQVGGSGSSFVVKTNGNVGIGATNPGAKLVVGGDLIVGTTLTVSGWGGITLPNGNITLGGSGKKLTGGSVEAVGLTSSQAVCPLYNPSITTPLKGSASYLNNANNPYGFIGQYGVEINDATGYYQFLSWSSCVEDPLGGKATFNDPGVVDTTAASIPMFKRGTTFSKGSPAFLNVQPNTSYPTTRRIGIQNPNEDTPDIFCRELGYLRTCGFDYDGYLISSSWAGTPSYGSYWLTQSGSASIISYISCCN